MRHRRALVSLALAVCVAPACHRLPKSYVVLLPHDDGSIGAVEVNGPEGTAIVSEPWKAETLAGGKRPVEISRQEVDERFGNAIAASPVAPAHFLLYFESDTARMTPQSKKLLPKVLDAVNDHPAPDVDVIGHTDTAGPSRYNDRLALRRAQAIRDEIVAIGIDPKMIEVTSHGQRDPLVKTGDGIHEPRNRRVEIVVR